MSDDGVREIHGVRCCDNNMGRSLAQIEARESEDVIVIQYDGKFGAVMTQYQARYLAAKLYRLSRRIRDRKTTNSEE